MKTQRMKLLENKLRKMVREELLKEDNSNIEVGLSTLIFNFLADTMDAGEARELSLDLSEDIMGYLREQGLVS